MWVNDRPFLPNHRLDLFYSPSLPLYFPSSFSFLFFFCFRLLSPHPQPHLSFVYPPWQSLNCFCFCFCLTCSLSRPSVSLSLLFIFAWHICPSKSETPTVCPSSSHHQDVVLNSTNTVEYTQQWMPYFASPRPCALS